MPLLFWAVIGTGVLVLGGAKLFGLWLLPGVPPPGPFGNEWKDRIKGGLADTKTPSDFNRKSLLKGMRVEMEHTNDSRIAMEIAMDHLTEDPAYYEKLERMVENASSKRK